MKACRALVPLFCSLPAILAAGVTLEEYARSNVVTVHTVGVRTAVPLADSDQTNNLLEGEKVLPLSGKGLTNLDGIATLRVVDQGREVPLSEVKKLHVFLNDNAISRLPREFLEMQNVIFLYLYDNRLDAIPPGITHMRGLVGMYITGNRLTAIAPEVFTMTRLKKLQLSKNRITEVPDAIGNLTGLVHFNMSDNQISVLPDSIARLTKLRVCDFSGNRIARLPEAFGQVRIVHQLRVCNNPLTTLPAGFAGMPGSIDITGTKIDLASLPPGLRANIGREKRREGPKPDSKPARDR